MYHTHKTSMATYMHTQHGDCTWCMCSGLCGVMRTPHTHTHMYAVCNTKPTHAHLQAHTLPGAGLFLNQRLKPRR